MASLRGWWTAAVAVGLGMGLVACEMSKTTIEVVEVSSVQVTPSSVTLSVGQTQELRASIRGGGGKELGGRTVTWTLTSGSGVVTLVSSNLTATVTGVGAGAATITATSEGVNATATATVPVRELTVSKDGTATGNVTSSPPGISCGADCSEGYAQGTVVTLTATPTGALTEFGGWTGACTGTNPTCQVTMDAAKTVTATFNILSRQLTVTKVGAGAGSVFSDPTGIACGADCSESFPQGTVVTLTASPTEGSSIFSEWSGACTGRSLTCQVTMDAAKTVTALFEPIPRTLTVSRAGSGTGTVTSAPAGISCGDDCAHEFPHGATVTLTATPGTGSTFAGWSGACSGTGSTCQVTMSEAKEVTATFDSATPTLTVTRVGTGTGSVTSDQPGISCGADCSESYDFGLVVTLTATPQAGTSAFAGWSGACSGTDPVCVVTMDQAKTATATFNLLPRALTVVRAGSGAGTVTSNPAGVDCGADCSESYPHGTAVTLTATAASGSVFKGWSGGCSGTQPTCQVAMNTAVTVTATFDLPNTLSVTVVGPGTVTSAPTGINCGADCAESFGLGTVVTLTATPGSGATFAGWSGACSGTATTCQVTMNSDQAVTATFTVQDRTLTVSKAGTGTGTVTSSPPGINCGSDCQEAYADGTTVVLTASADATSVFSSWSGCTSSAGSTCNVILGSNRTVTATFTLRPAPPSSISATDGTTTGGVNVIWGAVSGASSYNVYRSTSAAGTYTVLSSGITTTSWWDTSVNPSTFYYYRVTTVVSGIESLLSSAYDSGYRAALGAPSNVSATDGTGNGAGGVAVRVTWNAVSGASGYQVYRATSATGTYTLLYSTPNLYYDDYSASYNTTYYYTVRAYVSTSFPGVWSGYDSGWRWNVNNSAELQGWWTFDNTWWDAYYPYADFTSLVGPPTFSTGRIVGTHAAYFDGTDLATSAGSTFMSADRRRISVSFWVAFMSSYTPINRFMICDDFFIDQSNGYDLSFAISLPTTSAATTTLPASTWTHIVGTYDGSYIRIYRNGSLAASQYHPGTVSNLGRNLRIGGLDSPTWRGYIDDLRIYNRVLTAAEIQGLYGWR